MLKSAPPVFGVDEVPPAVVVPGVAAPPVWAVFGVAVPDGVTDVPPVAGAEVAVVVVVVAVVLVCDEAAEALPVGGAVSTGVVFGTS